MFVQIHTDRQIDGGSERAARVEDRVRERLARFEDRLTHIEIHVTDMNGGKGASGLRATLEARVNGLDPVAVTEEGATVDRAVLGAAGKAARALGHKLGRLTDRTKAVPAS
ncbi:HPF/RaiA family ribosome-associated protein [Allosphingosinicella sp.]|uniref:HPF/RaiA family ribosome-associated protein n=1 Tax=Allosphingosinicella sp. TaxID=2823234 RepID=UPI002FC25015